jgi:hypothetical protein
LLRVFLFCNVAQLSNIRKFCRTFCIVWQLANLITSHIPKNLINLLPLKIVFLNTKVNLKVSPQFPYVSTLFLLYGKLIVLFLGWQNLYPPQIGVWGELKNLLQKKILQKYFTFLIFHVHLKSNNSC